MTVWLVTLHEDIHTQLPFKHLTFFLFLLKSVPHFFFFFFVFSNMQCNDFDLHHLYQFCDHFLPAVCMYTLLLFHTPIAENPVLAKLSTRNVSFSILPLWQLLGTTLPKKE